MAKGSYPTSEMQPLRELCKKNGSSKVPAPSIYQELLQWKMPNLFQGHL